MTAQEYLMENAPDLYQATLAVLEDSHQALKWRDEKIEEQARTIEELEKKLVLIGERAVVDWDGKTVGEINTIVKNGNRYQDWIKEVFDSLKRLATAEERNKEFHQIDILPALKDGDS